jgi:plasmid stabilization system protein ParE
MARVVVAQRARKDLAELIQTRSLPVDTASRVRSSIEPLASFPQIGKLLTRRWRGFRLILDPWPWMLIVYLYDEPTNTVAILAIHDAREASSATSEA